MNYALTYGHQWHKEVSEPSGVNGAVALGWPASWY